MRPSERRWDRLRNWTQSVLLFGGMLGLLYLCVVLLTGGEGVIFVLAGGVLGIILSPRLPLRTTLNWYGVIQLNRHDLATLHKVVDRLALKAGLPQPPGLYYHSGRELNSFAVGRRNISAIILTDGLLRHLTMREISGVIAHEISHISNGDLAIMQLADAISRITRLMSYIGIAIGLVSLPLAILGRMELPFIPLVLLIMAPGLMNLLQLGLSRTREFDADRHAVALTGDPVGLGRALAKIDAAVNPTWRRIFNPSGGGQVPSLFRSHPPTVERLKRLHAMQAQTSPMIDEDRLSLPPVIRPARRRRVWW